MNILNILLLVIAGGVFGICAGLICNFITQSRINRLYQSVIDQYLHAETNIENHVRKHVLKDKDWDWAEGMSPLTTFGIKEDFTLMTDEEFMEAKEIAAKKMRG